MRSSSVSDCTWIDSALYPETSAPAALNNCAERVDFIARLCAAWDFGILPNPDTVAEVCRIEWREAIEACRLLTSPAYHLLRRWHGLAPLPYLGQQLAYIRDDPNLMYV